MERRTVPILVVRDALDRERRPGDLHVYQKYSRVQTRWRLRSIPSPFPLKMCAREPPMSPYPRGGPWFFFVAVNVFTK